MAAPPSSLTDRGMAYLDKDLLDRAIADFDAALEIDPDHGSAFANRARRLST